MGGDDAQDERRLPIGVEIRPVHRDDDLLSIRHDNECPICKVIPNNKLVIAEQAVYLLGCMFRDKTTCLSKRMTNNWDGEGGASYDAEGGVRYRLKSF